MSRRWDRGPFSWIAYEGARLVRHERVGRGHRYAFLAGPRDVPGRYFDGPYPAESIAMDIANLTAVWRRAARREAA